MYSKEFPLILKKDLKSSTGTRIDSIISSKYISKGSFGIVHKITFRIKNKTFELVEKTGDYEGEEISRQLKIHQKLKNTRINTFETFRSDGKSFFSSPLNTHKTIAISSKNDPPKEWGNAKIQEITNFNDILKKMIIQGNLAQKEKIFISADSLFFIVPLSAKYNNKANIDFLVADLDLVKDVHIKNINQGLLLDFYDFVSRYIFSKNKKEYLSKILNAFQETEKK